MKESGLVTADAWIRDDLDPAIHGAGWEEFREIWATTGEKPDGLVVLDDALFADAQLALIEMGLRVPGDLQLVVQTNRGASPPARVPIVAVEIDPDESAAAHVEMLMKRLRGDPLAPTTRLLSFCEIGRASCRERV